MLTVLANLLHFLKNRYFIFNYVSDCKSVLMIRGVCRGWRCTGHPRAGVKSLWVTCYRCWDSNSGPHRNNMYSWLQNHLPGPYLPVLFYYKCLRKISLQRKKAVPIFRGVSHGWLALFTYAVVSEDAVYNGGKKRAKQMSANLITRDWQRGTYWCPTVPTRAYPQWPKNSHQALILKDSTTSTWLRNELLRNTLDLSSYLEPNLETLVQSVV